jgi:hypothetical protein
MSKIFGGCLFNRCPYFFFIIIDTINLSHRMINAACSIQQCHGFAKNFSFGAGVVVNFQIF